MVSHCVLLLDSTYLKERKSKSRYLLRQGRNAKQNLAVCAFCYSRLLSFALPSLEVIGLLAQIRCNIIKTEVQDNILCSMRIKPATRGHIPIGFCQLLSCALGAHG